MKQQVTTLFRIIALVVVFVLMMFPFAGTAGAESPEDYYLRTEGFMLERLARMTGDSLSEVVARRIAYDAYWVNHRFLPQYGRLPSVLEWQQSWTSRLNDFVSNYSQEIEAERGRRLQLPMPVQRNAGAYYPGAPKWDLEY